MQGIKQRQILLFLIIIVCISGCPNPPEPEKPIEIEPVNWKFFDKIEFQHAARGSDATVIPDKPPAPKDIDFLTPPFLEEPLQTGERSRFVIKYLYRPFDNGEFREIANGGTLHSGDAYKIIFTPAEESYVYIFQFDSAEKMHCLFPMESFEGVKVNNFNPVQGGQTYYLPAKNKSFVLDEQIGVETIYFWAFRQRNSLLEEQYQQALLKQEQQNYIAQIPAIEQLLTYALKTQGKMVSSELPFPTTAAEIISSLPQPELARIEDETMLDQFPKVGALLGFKVNSIDIQDESLPLLQEFAKALQSDALQDAMMVIAGHTDNFGEESYNLELSRRRAEAVKNFLVETYQIPANRLTVKFYGENRPLASNDTREGRAKNRRIEFIRIQ